VHTTPPEASEALDPLTYEVVRHRLWSVTDEMGEALKRMSGSTIVTDANDFDFAISDELGQEVQVGLYNTMLVGAVDLAIYWVLKNREVREGDMFLCNDPWIGGGLHQSDVIVFQPIFHDGKLFAWTSAVCHEPDLGGVGLGSFDPAAQDVFSEPVPTRPSRWCAASNSRRTSPTCGCAAPGFRCSSGWTCEPRSARTRSAARGCWRSSSSTGRTRSRP